VDTNIGGCKSWWFAILGLCSASALNTLVDMNFGGLLAKPPNSPPILAAIISSETV